MINIYVYNSKIDELRSFSKTRKLSGKKSNNGKVYEWSANWMCVRVSVWHSCLPCPTIRSTCYHYATNHRIAMYSLSCTQCILNVTMSNTMHMIQLEGNLLILYGRIYCFVTQIIFFVFLIWLKSKIFL